jgi:hypothetical protein
MINELKKNSNKQMNEVKESIQDLDEKNQKQFWHFIKKGNKKTQK